MASGFYKYSQLINNTTNYAKRMTRLRARIFVEVPRPTNPKSMKVVQLMSEKSNDMRPEYVDYYPPHTEVTLLMKALRHHGLFRDEHEDFRDEMKRLRELRGKGGKKKPAQKVVAVTN